MTRRLTWRLFVLALFALALPAHAQTSERRVGVVWHEGAPDVSFSAADFADAAMRRQLARGLQQTIVMRTYAYGDRTTPIAVSVRSCQVVYDIWADRYSVDIRTESSDRSVTLDTVDDVVEACLVADHLVVGDAAAWRGRHGDRITFGVVLELNPITPDMVQRIRRWLARPEGGAAPDEAFFGSFVSLFVNRQISAAERTASFSSPEYTCP
jgi:hypothetical protein